MYLCLAKYKWTEGRVRDLGDMEFYKHCVVNNDYWAIYDTNDGNVAMLSFDDMVKCTELKIEIENISVRRRDGVVYRILSDNMSYGADAEELVNFYNGQSFLSLGLFIDDTCYLDEDGLPAEGQRFVIIDKHSGAKLCVCMRDYHEGKEVVLLKTACLGLQINLKYEDFVRMVEEYNNSVR